MNTSKDEDANLTYVLKENPNFDELETLTKQNESGVLKFIGEIERFLKKQS